MARKSATKKIKKHDRIQSKKNSNSTSLNHKNAIPPHDNVCSGGYSYNDDENRKDDVCMCFLRRGQMFLPPSLLEDRNTNNDDKNEKI